MKKNARKKEPLRVSSSYESYCRERKAARSRNEHGTSLRKTNSEQQPLIEIQSRDEDDDRLNAKRNNKLTPVTIPSMASWSVSSKSIVNSWYEPTASITNETNKTIQSYASNTGVFSPVYEVTAEHTNIFEQNGLPLPEPGRTPRFGSLRYKADDVNAPIHSNGREAHNSDSFQSDEVSSQQVRDKLKQLKKKTVRLLGATTPVPSLSTHQQTELGIGESYVSEKTFESYLRGEWRLGSTSGSIEVDLSLDPIVQVRGSSEEELNNSTSAVDVGREPVRRIPGSEITLSPEVSPGRGGTTGIFESGHEETSNCSVPCISLQHCDTSQRKDEDEIRMSVSAISSSDPSVVDLTLVDDNDLGSERKPLSLENILSTPSRTEFIPHGTKDALAPPNLLDITDTTITRRNWSPDKHNDDVLTDVTSTSHNRTDQSESDGDSSRLTERIGHENNQNTTDAPSAEQIYQSIVDREMKKQRGLTPKSSKAITISLESEDLKPVVILSRQFAHSEYRQGNDGVLIPNTSNLLARSCFKAKVEGEALSTDHWQKLEVNRRGVDENEGEKWKRQHHREKVVLEGVGRHGNEISPTNVGDTLLDEIRYEITRMHSDKWDEEHHYPRGCDERHPLRIGSHDLDIPDLNDICLQATGSDFDCKDLNDDELRAVMQMTNDGDNVSVIFPTFSCDTVHECYSDDGLSRELNALSPLQKEIEISLKAASAISPSNMPQQLTSPVVYDGSTDSSMVDLQSLCKSRSESNEDRENFRTSLPFTRRVHFRDEVQELLFTHELDCEADPLPRRSFFDRLFSSFDDLIDGISTACVACSGGGRYHEKSVQSP